MGHSSGGFERRKMSVYFVKTSGHDFVWMFNTELPSLSFVPSLVLTISTSPKRLLLSGDIELN